MKEVQLECAATDIPIKEEQREGAATPILPKEEEPECGATDIPERGPQSPGASPRGSPCVAAVKGLQATYMKSDARGQGGKRIKQTDKKEREKERHPQWAMDLVAMLLTSLHVPLGPNKRKKNK